MSQDKETNQTPETQDESYEGILGDYQEPEATEAPVPEKEKKSEKNKRNNGKKNKTALTIVGVSASVVLLGCLGFMGVSLMKKQQASRSVPAASTEHMSVSKQMLACYYKNIVDNYAEYYGADYLLNYYQLDLSQPLKDQMTPFEDGTTWFEMIMTQAQNTALQQLMVAEAAQAAGFEMTAEMEQSVEEQLAEMDVTKYGNGVTIDDVRDMLRLQTYTTAYYAEYGNNLEISDDQVENYYEENRTQFDTCDFVYLAVPFENEEEASDGEDADGSDEAATSESEAEEASDEETASETEAEETSDEETASETEAGETSDEASTDKTKERAEQIANELAAVSDVQGFEKKAEEILKEYEGHSDEEVQNELASIYLEGYYYMEGSELTEWAFSGASVGESYIVESDSAYFVYMLTREPGPEDEKTVNIRHILFNVSDHTGEDGDTNTAFDECRQLAEACLAEWESGDKTEDSFAELASARTEDPGSADTGGLYEYVYEGQMVQPFNDWCFDPNRKPGDTGLVESDYGVHVMYFVEEAGPYWKASIVNSLKSAAIQDWFTELEEVYPVTFDEEVISTIEE